MKHDPDQGADTGNRPGAGAPSSFGQLLRARRLALGLSLAQLAARLYFDKGHVSKIETDKRLPSPVFAQACDKVLDTGNTFEIIAAALSATTGRQQTWIRPAQLPAAHRRFIGREQYLDRLDALLHSDNDSMGVLVAVIDGLPGVGKTALAVQWAQQAVARGHFDDGQLFLTLRDPWTGAVAEPFDVLGDMLRALGMPAAQLPAGTEQRSAAFRSLVHGRKVLVVLDDATDTRQIRSLLPGSRGCAVVVTSRVRLPGLASQVGAVTMTLPELSTPESIGLIRSMMGDARMDAGPDLMDTLVRQCGHLPLALGQAGEHIVDDWHRNAAALVSLMNPEADRTDGTISDVFDSIDTMFGQDAARLLLVLGTLPDPAISAADAAAVAGIDEERARHLLRRLASAHLVQDNDEQRFEVNDLLRAYVAELAKQQTAAEHSPTTHLADH